MAQIKTYARLKPSKKPFSGYEISKNVLTVHIPDNKDFLLQGSQQPARSNLSYDIVFTDIFKPEATQEDVFDGVAKGIIESFLNGYNGTIFAYGQTGTGKTYTVEGNTSRYSTRGLSTRALSMIYQQLENRAEDHITVCLSYLEIYQEVAYDLLNPVSRSSLPMAPFAKVTVVEGPRGSCIFRGLSLHLAANEEIAQMLLLQGQANRRVAETPVNQRSSRSHAVFTVYLQVRKHDSDVLLNSKLHLVDLAGSERVSKTGVDGQQLTEAKSINLSLHHLETVIIALQTDRSSSASSSSGADRSRGDYPPTQSRSNTSFMSGPSSDSGSKPYRFVPYRNSLLTMVLKDSLGGNCLTAMIATISMEPENLGESISTCRFAQRVARIANNARRNEEVDDKTLIKRLKHKVANLEQQVALLRSKGRSDSVIADDEILNVLSEEDRTACAKIMEGFLQGVIADPVDAGIYDQCRFRECLHLLKRQYLHSVARNSQYLTSQQLQPQPRQITGEQADESSLQMQPNNPHRDSGDHIVSETSQRDATLRGNQQRPLVGCFSSTSVHVPDEYLVTTEDPVVGASNAVLKPQITEKKGSEMDPPETYGGDRYGYDKRRAKEMKKLGQKLTSLEQEQADKQEQLEQMKQDILMQELLAAENNLRLKLQVADDQVADQHAYLLQLKHIQADEVQIAREQLVEQHLLKRQAKFHDKLCKLLENKAKLERTLSSEKDTSSLICAGCNKLSLEDRVHQLKQGKGSIHVRQVYDVQKSEEREQQQLDSAKFDREKFIIQKTKQLAAKEASTLDKLRELKQRLRMSQQQVDPMPGRNPGQNTSEKYQIQCSESNESNQLPSNDDCLYSCHKCHHESDIVVDEEAQHDQTWIHPSIASSRTGLHSVVDGSEQQPKLPQEYQTSGYKEKHASDTRQGRYSGPIKQEEAVMKPESCSSYMQPYQQGLTNSPLLQQENAVQTPAQVLRSILSESPRRSGTGPMEVRSFHDPHHSHKFSLDDRPAECSSLNITKPSTAEGFNNKNNSYIRFTNSRKNYLHNSNFNANANSDNLESHETKKEVEQSAQSLEHEKQTSAVIDSSKCLEDRSSNCGPKVSDLEMLNGLKSDQLNGYEDSKQAETQYRDLTDSGYISGKTYHDLRCTYNNTCVRAAGCSSELPGGCVKFSSTSPRAQSSPANTCLPVLKSRECKNLLTDEDIVVQKAGSQSWNFESALSYMLQQGEEAGTSAVPHGVIPLEKQSHISMLLLNKHHSEDTVTSPPQNMFLEETNRTDEPSGLLRACCSYIPPQEKNSEMENKPGNGENLINKTSLNFLQKKMTNHKWREQVEEEEEDDDDGSIYDVSEADSFFGLQPAKMKIRALTPEERERTYMSTVAAEKARIAKIRKARRAAEIIQRHWRAYKAEE